jgi:hypothetical protein
MITPARGKTTAKSTSTSFAPKSQTPSTLTLVPTTPTRNLLQLSSDLRQPSTNIATAPSTADLEKRVELSAVIADIQTDFHLKDHEEPYTLIARFGRIIGVEPDDWTLTSVPAGVVGWRWQKEYGMMMPALNTEAGRAWHDRLSALGELNSNVDMSAGSRGGIGAASYPVRPFED